MLKYLSLMKCSCFQSPCFAKIPSLSYHLIMMVNAEVVNKLLVCRVPGEDEILKVLDVVGLSLQHRVDIGGSASGLADRGGGPSF